MSTTYEHMKQKSKKRTKSNHLLIPGQPLHMISRLASVPRGHGLAGVVEVPNEDLTIRGPGSEQVLLVWVDVQGRDLACGNQKNTKATV